MCYVAARQHRALRAKTPISSGAEPIFDTWLLAVTVTAIIEPASMNLNQAA
jgi:hypothetical protein